MTDRTREAVTIAAERMRIYREHGGPLDTGPRCKPDWPIVELRERGVIDARTEATLTATAYRMSLEP